MTIAANRPAPVLSPGAAQDTLREMAAVIRTVFGVGLQASRQAALDAAAAESVMNEVEAAPAAPGPLAVHHRLHPGPRPDAHHRSFPRRASRSPASPRPSRPRATDQHPDAQPPPARRSRRPR